MKRISPIVVAFALSFIFAGTAACPAKKAATTATTTAAPRPTAATRSTVPTPAARAPAGRAPLEPGIDRGGSDYRDFDLDAAKPELCQNACSTDAQCKAFTYVKPGVQGTSARCWLKNAVPDKSENDCCVSGVK